MSAFFGSIVGNVISFLEWAFYSMPTAVWFVLAAVAVGLGVWAMGNDEFSEIVSDSRTTHSLASSFGMGYLFMLVTQAIHPGKYGYAYVTLAKKGMTFSAFDPGTWHFTFIVFLILLLISTLAALILSGGVSIQQIVLNVVLDLLWAVVVRFLLSDSLALIQAVLRFGMSIIVFFATPVCLFLSIFYLFCNPKKELQEERSELRRQKHNLREMYLHMPKSLTLPSGRVVHRVAGTSSEPVTYNYEGGFHAFTVTADHIRTLPNGRQEIVIKCSEYDDEPEHIPLPNKVYVRHKPKK